MNFKIEKITETLKVLDSRIYCGEVSVEGFKARQCGYKKGNDLPVVDETWRDFGKYDTWHGSDDHFWFYKKFNVEDRGHQAYFCINYTYPDWNVTNPQFIVYINGKMIQGMDCNHTDIPVENGETEMYLYAYTGDRDRLYGLECSIKYLDEICEKVYYDIKVPFDVCRMYEKTDKTHIDIMSYLSKAADMLDLRIASGSEYHDSLYAAENYLQKEFYGRFCGGLDLSCVCIGHTHIDVAWLWTLAQTREKVLRSFSTVVRLMQQYPEYKFMSSQAQLYKYVKEESPELYKQIKELVKQGRWEVEGASWVEFDCNLSSGEGIVRQILLGKKFFKEEFGVESNILWLPDVFGYSAALPQILKKSGVNRFVTSKLSWSETNTVPYDLFYWQGIDGSQVLSWFLTAQNKIAGEKSRPFTNYNSRINPQQIAGGWDRFQQKDLTKEIIVTFGHGDGGGGPTKKMLENYSRLKKGIPGCPTAVMDTAGAFFERLEKKIKNTPDVPRWVGELYLELHRGTYTSIAKNKRNNRKSEFAYQSAELFSSISSKLTGFDYPQQKINECWEIILTNQFHDILPGSSIKEVYDVSDIEYKHVLDTADGILNNCYTAIAEGVNTDEGIVVFNPNSFENSDVVEVDGSKVYVENIPPLGYKAVTPVHKKSTVKVTDNSLENKFFKMVFDGDFNIKRIYDKNSKREVLKGKGNVLQAFEDRPKCYDAWEITNYYKDKMWEINDVISSEPIFDGARAGIKVKKRFLSSVIEQSIYLYDDIGRIDFETEIDWKQDHILLKAAFPVDVHTDKATYDIQFGSAERPTHRNTSWDAAKFEVCAHKFADVSEDGYGVSLINDCKYGYDILDTTMRLTLLKCATDPNPAADKEHHSFIYSLYPHKGSFSQGGTIHQAYSLNRPMVAVKAGAGKGTLNSSFSFVKCDCENIIIETVKKAEADNGTVIRLFDSYKRRSRAKLDFGFNVKKAVLCDMMENEIKELAVKDNSVTLDAKPFEILTIKVF